MSATSGAFGYKQGRGGIATTDDPPGAFEDAYWLMVRRVLKVVFSASASLADDAQARLQLLQQEGGESAPRAVFYHASPLEVAADLAGRATPDISAAQRRAYLEMVGSHDIPPADDLHPRGSRS